MSPSDPSNGAGNEQPTPSLPRASIVIPAHDEEPVIGRCLDAILAESGSGEFEIWVVCNGCRDGTEQAAARYHDRGVHVVSIPIASKTAAINTGDSRARTFPRLYVDADVVVSTATVRALVATLESDSVAAAPSIILDTAGCTLPVRMYYRMWSRLGYATRSVLGGSGVYGLSRAGRSRFEAFPDVVADDYFVYCQFTAEERINPQGASSVVRPPRRLPGLYRRRIRVVQGNAIVEDLLGRRADVPGPGWREVAMREPRMLPAAVVFLGVNLAARLAASRRRSQGRAAPWGRDESTRQGVQ